MSHRLLSQYPALDGSFLFLNVYVLPKLLYPLLPSPPQSKEDPTVLWGFLNGFKRDYLNASDEDFHFTLHGHPCEEAAADQMLFRTSLLDREGRRICILAKPNSNPKSRWFASTFVLEPTAAVAPVSEAPASQPAAGAEAAPPAGEPLPLTRRYPNFFDLVFLHNDKIQERLVLLTGDNSLTVQKVRAAFSTQYQLHGLEVCQFTQNGQESTPEEADTLYFSTGMNDINGKAILLQCERNRSGQAEPWFGKFFNTSDWKDTTELQGLFSKVRIFDSHVEYGLFHLAVDLDQTTSLNARRTSIAKRYHDLAPEEILYYKGSLPVAGEEEADHMILPTGYHGPNGEEIMLRCKRNQESRYPQPWVSRRFFLPSQNSFQGRKPGSWLFSWAKFQDLRSSDLTPILRQLKNMAMDEPWSLGPEDNLSILRNYLIYTFVRLWREGKVKERAQYAAFNTGLVNQAYEYIYAIFSPSPTAATDGRKWMFRGFCIASEDFLGKELTRTFFPLPQPARYFRLNEPIYFCFHDNLDAKAQIPYYDSGHILLERTYRLPIPFLRKYAYQIPGLEEKLSQLERLNGQGDPRLIRSLWSEVSGMLRQRKDTSVYRDMNNDLDKALEMAVRRAAWNYRTAIPYYTPMDDSISLLLPISLATNNGTPDVAMVLEPIQEDGFIHYLGHTIITLSMAYGNSRLVCRPESDWLNVSAVQAMGGAAPLDAPEEEDA